MTQKDKELESRLDELEDMVKERESSFLRALKTLVEDWMAFQRGEREDFPHPALLGAIFAYLRPRVIIVIGAIGAMIVGGIQIWLLLNQNTLLAQQNLLLDIQNTYVNSQSESNRLQAVTSVLSNLDPENTQSSELAIAQLSAFGSDGFEVLIQLAQNESSSITSLAQYAIARSAHMHTEPQCQTAISVLLRNYESVTYVFASFARISQSGLEDVTDTEEIFDVGRDWIKAGNRLLVYLRSYAKIHGQVPIPDLPVSSLERSIQSLYSASEDLNNSIFLARGKLKPEVASRTGTFAVFDKVKPQLEDDLDDFFGQWCTINAIRQPRNDGTTTTVRCAEKVVGAQ